MIFIGRSDSRTSGARARRLEILATCSPSFEDRTLLAPQGRELVTTARPFFEPRYRVCCTHWAITSGPALRIAVECDRRWQGAQAVGATNGLHTSIQITICARLFPYKLQSAVAGACMPSPVCCVGDPAPAMRSCFWVAGRVGATAEADQMTT